MEKVFVELCALVDALVSGCFSVLFQCFLSSFEVDTEVFETDVRA